jgi:hypothetical protein
VYYAKKQRYIGSFDSREKAAFVHEIVREKLQVDAVVLPCDLEAVEAAFNSALKAALEAVVGVTVRTQDQVSRQIF